MTFPNSRTLAVDGIGAVALDLLEHGAGRRPVLLLHGGGGPLSVTPWAESFAEAAHARVITPVHPGFGGTARPGALDSIAGLAAVYHALLAELDLRDVLVVGNSLGGWIAAEMAAVGSRRVSGYVLLGAVGVEIPDLPAVDVFALTPQEVADRSWFDPAGRVLDPSALPPEAQAILAGNRATARIYGGATMSDPTLADRLRSVVVPTLVVWGEADGIRELDYGRALAAAIPGARFEILPRAGHLPQLEQPHALTALVRSFAPAV